MQRSPTAEAGQGLSSLSFLTRKDMQQLTVTTLRNRLEELEQLGFGDKLIVTDDGNQMLIANTCGTVDVHPPIPNRGFGDWIVFGQGYESGDSERSLRVVRIH